MEFIEKNEDNNIIVSLVDGDEKARATIYYENTPQKNGSNIGCIGDISIVDLSYGTSLLKKCTELLIENGVKHIVGPMNGNTWKKYRTMKYSRGDSLFLLENVDPIEYNDVFLKEGFSEVRIIHVK